MSITCKAIDMVKFICDVRLLSETGSHHVFRDLLIDAFEEGLGPSWALSGACLLLHSKK